MFSLRNEELSSIPPPMLSTSLILSSDCLFRQASFLTYEVWKAYNKNFIKSLALDILYQPTSMSPDVDFFMASAITLMSSVICFNLLNFVIVSRGTPDFWVKEITSSIKFPDCMCSRTSMARTPLVPWTYVQDRGSSKLMSVNHSARPGGIIGISFWFSLTWRYVVCSQ